MPAGGLLLLGAELSRTILLVELVKLNRADGANLGITAAKLSFVVQNRVNVQARCSRTSGQPAKTKNQLLLELVGEVILGAEEDDTTL